MTAMSEKIDRIMGNHRTGVGGGFALPDLLNPILETILDNEEPQRVESLIHSVREKCSNHARIISVFGSWHNLVTDALDIMATGDFVRCHNGSLWGLGERFRLGESMLVVNQRKGKNRPGTITVFSKEERARRDADAHKELELNRLVNDLRPEGPGGRSLDEKRLTDLRDKMTRNGWLPGSFVVKDQHGRIIDGRHRVKVAEELGIEPKIEMVSVESDEEMVRLFWRHATEDETVAWPKRDRDRVAARIAGCGIDLTKPYVSQKDQRAIDIANKPEGMSNRQHAKNLGVSRQTVNRHLGGTNVPSPIPEKPISPKMIAAQHELMKDPNRTNRQIAIAAGEPDDRSEWVKRARAVLVERGDIPDFDIVVTATGKPQKLLRPRRKQCCPKCGHEF